MVDDSFRYTYTNMSQRYKLSNLTWTKQFNHLYEKRLDTVRELIYKQARFQWGEELPMLEQLVDLTSGTIQVVAGILVKIHGKRKSITTNYKIKVDAFKPIISQNEYEDFYAPDDRLLIEDEGGRVNISLANPDMHRLIVNGLAIGIKGIL
jgi:hypothetical protein